MNKKELRDKFFKEHTYKCENGIPLVVTHPHNLFEWMYEQLTISVVSVSLKCEFCDKDATQHINASVCCDEHTNYC
jgi:hypothetical protein